MATASILHHPQPGALSAAQPSNLTGSSSTAQSSSSSSSSSGDSSVISANDFLSLLVTEMQNQDPTSDTDPNEYINQLVQVNSLEQLIQMNQTLSTAFGISNASAGGPTAGAQPSSNGNPLPTSAAAPNASAASVLSATGSKAAAAHQVTESGRSQSNNKLVAGISQFAGSSGSQTISGALGKARSALSGNLASPKNSPAATRVAHALDGQKRSQ